MQYEHSMLYDTLNVAQFFKLQNNFSVQILGKVLHILKDSSYKIIFLF